MARLAGWLELDVDPAWWAFAAAALVIAIDVSRTVVSYRTARRHSSAAILSNAVHFGADLLGTLAVVAGLVAARAGFPEGDSIAALFVAVLVVVAAARLIRRNVDVLMDRAPAGAVDAAREAIGRLDPPVVLRRLRLRQAGGRTFADVVIGVSPGAAVGQGHATADRVEAAVQRALPGSDVVVHVEPAGREAELRERVRAAAMTVSHVRELHDLAVIDTGDGLQLSLHLKLPGGLDLGTAHAMAEQVEEAIRRDVPEVGAVQTHLEPLAERAPGREWTENLARIEQTVVADHRRPAPRPAHARDGRRARRAADPRPRRADDAVGGPRRGDRGVGADPRGPARRRRRRGPHRAVTLFLRGIRIRRSGSGSRTIPAFGGADP